MEQLNLALKNIVEGKKGLEIGGPSETTGNIIYENAALVDNVIFSSNTVWSTHSDEYNYYKNKIGKVIINDATDIDAIDDNLYDFIFASHTLEHIANPIKAIKEWIRITKDNGYIILILPEKSKCFDHNRNITSFKKLINQYENGVNEDDLSTLGEILKLHDLSLDPAAGTFEQFTRRSLDNFNNRCLHHYIYSQDLLKEICEYVKCEFIQTLTDGLNIWFIMRILS